MEVEARLEGAALVIVLSPARQGKQEDVSSPGLAANGLGHGIAVKLRQADIQQCDLRPEIAGADERLLAIVGNTDVMSLGLQEERQALRRVDIVIDDEDAARAGGKPRALRVGTCARFPAISQAKGTRRETHCPFRAHRSRP